jgi:hypothetical protein
MAFSGDLANPGLGGLLPFLGTFDGAGYTISNLLIEGTRPGQALFQYLGPGAIVKDLTVAGSVSGSYHTAGIAALSAGTVAGVTNRVIINATNDILGGIVGEGLEGFVVTDCRNEATITNESQTKSSGRLGGIVGKAEGTGTISRCANVADIDGYQYVGGIIGGQFGNVTVEYCYNTADLIARSFGKVYLGGIAGKSGGGSIANCYNTGKLSDAHWATGHIRAIGGIAGCEEGRPGGVTAIRNCYTTGLIDMYTDNMSGSNNIYEVGNISGGNNTTDYNTMRYENCFYLEGRIAIADPQHPGYELWGDGYKQDPLIWDSLWITSVDEVTLKSPEFIALIGPAFVTDEESVNNGYPVLAWQLGREVEDGANAVSIETYPSEYADYVLASAEAALPGEMVSAIIDSSIASQGMRPYQITAIDSAGNAVALSLGSDLMSLSFAMPSQALTLRVIFGTDVSAEDGYRLLWPSDLDAIWYQPQFLSAAGDTDNAIPAGSTVYVTVEKNPDAITSSLTGLLATAGGQELTVHTIRLEEKGNAGYAGLFAFTMPEADVTLVPAISYQPLEVSRQLGQESAQPVKSYSRAELLAIAGEDLYYSGYNSDTDGFIGKASQGVTLTALLADAGLTFGPGQTLRLTSADGLITEFTWERLYGTQRCYYPHLLSGTTAEEKAADKLPIDAMLVIKGNVATGSAQDIETLVTDTLNTCRFVFGQNEAEFNNGVPSIEGKVDHYFPKYITGVTVVIPQGAPGSGDLNGDGVVTVSEALTTARVAVQGIATVGLSEAQVATLDIDGDGHLTMADVMLILRKAVGLL